MIPFDAFTLDNGLRVYVHTDNTTPLAVVNVAYNVGSRDEDEHKTGFAHLFEHLMFGGSKHIANYDEELQKVGGENNAFTSPDYTNYFVTIPSKNIETAFWLESDRMLSLSFDERVLEVQRKVVIEEFKQVYLNQPYGDVWLKLRPMAYTTHPYRWATIGKEIAHIEQATMDDVKSFFFKYYVPSNAVLVVAGNVTSEQVRELSEKWFGGIASGTPYERDLPTEPGQAEKRTLHVEDNVPVDAIYKAYHMPSRVDLNYYTADLMGDILGRGKSSRLYQKLVKDNPLFSELKAYVTGSHDPGLFVIKGHLNEKVGFEEAEGAIDKVIEQFVKRKVDEDELKKVQNQAEFTLVQNEVELLNRAIELAEWAILGNPDRVNEETELIHQITTKQVHEMAKQMLQPENCSVLYYHAKKKGKP